jgi:hypothetical protein
MDNLKRVAPAFYTGDELFRAALKKQPLLDEGGKQRVQAACRAKHIQEAKTASYMRRTHSDSFLNRSENGKELHLEDFEDLGPRWVKDADDIATRQDHKGWYTDDWCDNTLIGVVLCFSRHAAPDENGNTRGKGRQIFMAGTRHSDWDGVTLGLDTTDDMITAARWADSMAEREAEVCREDDEKYQIAQQVEGIQEEISLARQACLKLLRDMRPIRKGLMSLPESVYNALKDQVRDYLSSIAGYRTQLGELA